MQSPPVESFLEQQSLTYQDHYSLLVDQSTSEPKSTPQTHPTSSMYQDTTTATALSNSRVFLIGSLEILFPLQGTIKSKIIIDTTVK